jgi:hypothetical protein
MKPEIAFFILIAGQASLLTGCTLVTVETFRRPGTVIRALPDSQEILVYMSEADVPQPSEVIAVVVVSGSWEPSSAPRLLEMAKAEARILGGNALLLKRGWDGTKAIGSSRKRKLEADVMLVRDPASQKQPNNAPAPVAARPFSFMTPALETPSPLGAGRAPL